MMCTGALYSWDRDFFSGHKWALEQLCASKQGAGTDWMFSDEARRTPILVIVPILSLDIFPPVQSEDKSVKWETLEHSGVLFPPEYAPHGVKMLYDGKPVDLTPQQEEVHTFLIHPP